MKLQRPWFPAIIVLFCLSCADVLSAPAARLSGGGRAAIEEITVIPEDYLIGDAVTLRIVLSGAEAEQKTSVIESSKWFQIESTDQITRDDTVFLFFQVIPFYPGEREFPRLQYGNMTIDGITFSPRLLLTEEKLPFTPVRETMLLPGTELYMILTVLGIATATAAVVFLVKRFRRLYRNITSAYTNFRSGLQRRKMLHYLLQHRTELPQHEIYRQLTVQAKQSLERSCAVPCFHLTTKEIEAWSIAKNMETGKKLIPLFSRADAVRFGNKPVHEGQVLEDIRLLETVFSRRVRC